MRNKLYLLPFVFLIATQIISATTVTGVVFNEATQEPLAGASVVFFTVDASGDSAITEIFTDQYGSYGIDIATAGAYIFQFSHPGYEQLQYGPVSIVPSTDQINIDAPLQSLSVNNIQITGRIISEADGLPVSDALVVLRSVSALPFQLSALTNTDGNYEIENVSTGEYRLGVFFDGYYSEEYDETIVIGEDAQDLRIDFALTPFDPDARAEVTGKVYTINENGSMLPLQNVLVVYFNLDLPDSVMFEAFTDENGDYAISGLRPGTYNVNPMLDGFYDQSDPFVILEPGENTYDIELFELIVPPMGVVEGTVTLKNSNQPVRNAVVEFYPTGNERSAVIAAWTDQNGRYAVDLIAGKYRIGLTKTWPDSTDVYSVFYNEKTSLAEADTIFVGDGGQGVVDFSIPGPLEQPYSVTLEGRVTNDNGDPLPNTVVYLYERNLSPNGQLKTTPTENGSWSFTIDNIWFPNTSVTVAARNDQYFVEYYDNKSIIFEADPVVLNESLDGETVSNIDFSLTPLPDLETVGISGSVFNAEGEPVMGARVYVTDAWTGENFMTFTDSSGAYTAIVIAERSYYVLADANGYQPVYYDNASNWEGAEQLQTNSPVSDINFYLKPQGERFAKWAVTGIAVDYEGMPMPGVLVMLMNSEQEVVDDTFTATDGKFILHAPFAGEYEVVATKVTYNVPASKVWLDNSGTPEVTLSLDTQIVSVEDEEAAVPETIALYDNYPNPFNPSTVIAFSLPEAMDATVTVYNMLGQEITTLVNERLPAGPHEVTFNAKQSTSGVYFYKLDTASFTQVKKMILIK